MSKSLWGRKSENYSPLLQKAWRLPLKSWETGQELFSPTLFHSLEQIIWNLTCLIRSISDLYLPLYFMYLWIQEKCPHDQPPLLPETRGVFLALNILWLLYGCNTILESSQFLNGCSLHAINLTVMLYRRTSVDSLWSFRDMGTCYSHKMFIRKCFWNSHHVLFAVCF